MKTLKPKMYQNMTAKDRKSDVSYLNKLVDQYNNTYHHSIIKNPINDDYFPSNKKNWDKFWSS